MSNNFLSNEKLNTFNQKSLQSFNELKMPTKKDRPWRYTDVKHLDLETFDLSNSDCKVNIENDSQSGVNIDSFKIDKIKNEIKLFSEYIGTTNAMNVDKFSVANDAFWNHGILIHSVKNAVIEEMINIEINADNVAALPRIIIIAEENSEINIQINSSSIALTKLVIASVEVIARKSSRIKLFFVSNFEKSTEEFLYIRSKVEDNADLEIGLLPIEGKLFKHTIENSLIGKGSNASIRGFALGNENQHFDFVTIQDHVGIKSTSKVDIKSVLGDFARNIYYGITRVEESASDAQAEQSNRNLLLSSNAKADSDPVLEILTSQVIKCGHAATVGPIDADALYYLQSRGLTKLESTKLLVAGSYNQTFENMHLNNIQEKFLNQINDKLELIK
jgi:Fe-S cluster assembly protein SufD